MSRLGDFAFGVIGGKKGDQRSETKIAPEQLPYLQNIWGAGRDTMKQQRGQVGPAAQGFADQLYGQGQGFLGQMGAGAAQGLNQYQGPGFAQQQIGALADQSQQFLGNALQGVNSGAIGAGGLGGQRNQLMQGQAIGDATRGFQSAAAGLMQQDLDRQQQAGIAQAGIQGQTAMGGMSQLGGMYGLGMSPFAAQWSPMQQQAGLVGGPAMGNIGYDVGWGTQGGMTAYGNMKSSDRRLKRDIRALGEYIGHQWYRFRYLWSDVEQVGVMAQEVLKVSPQAVYTHPSGYLMVDYGAL